MVGGSPASFGFAAPAAVVQSGCASESWTCTAADVDAWMRTAKAGDALVYAHGPQLVHGGAAARVNELTKAGDVTPHHRRAGDGGFDFLVRRSRVQAIPRAPVCTPEMMAVLMVLQEAAENGERCPSDDEIGNRATLTGPRVKWQLQKLESAKFITRQTVRTKSPTVPWCRVVTVVATGMSTAGPDA